MLRSLFVVSLAVIVVLSGCQASIKPKPVVAVSATKAPKVRRAPFDGQYQLFPAPSASNADADARADEALATHRLRRGQAVGFRAAADGGLRAVAGEASIPLERGAYVWEMRADAGQVDLGRTAVTVLLVGGTATFMILTAMVF